MDEAIIKALKDERAGLERKLKAVNDMLAVYGASGYSKVSSKQAVTNKPPSGSPRTPSKKTLAIREAVHALIINCGEAPTPTRQILAHLESLGLDVGGKNPVATLSALLSHSDGFESIGRSGWIYREQNSPPDVAASGGEKSVEEDDFLGNLEPRASERTLERR